MLLRASAFVGLTLLVLKSLPSSAQTRDLDPAKLPQTPAVQAAYRNAQDLEPYSNAWTTKWTYDIPEPQVQDKLADDLGILRAALHDDPTNHELQLLTGLVAHFAYNVNDEAAFQIAIDNLTQAAASDPTDIRGEWFLGIHQCQALQVATGMNHLLAIEARVNNPPVDFWDDYIACANVALTPAHALRAVDRELASGAKPDRLKTVSGIATSHYKSADLSKTISAHDAWTADKLPSNRMAFTSRLCGVSFTVSGDSPLQINDISNGVCSITLSPPGKGPESHATILLMAKQAAAGQTLDDFARSFLHSRNAQVSTLPQSSCLIAGCSVLDIRIPEMYAEQGGAHILVAAFERDQPRYDGLPFEKPVSPPTIKGQQAPTYFRPELNFRRIPGKLFYLVVLDSNQQIFTASKPHFDAFLQSIVVE